jgi:hypothetical protein
LGLRHKTMPKPLNTSACSSLFILPRYGIQKTDPRYF